MTTARQLYPDHVRELIAERGDDLHLCVTYEEWYFGDAKGDPPSYYEVEEKFVEEMNYDLHGPTECLWLIPGTTEDMLADLELEGR